MILRRIDGENWVVVRDMGFVMQRPSKTLWEVPDAEAEQLLEDHPDQWVIASETEGPEPVLVDEPERLRDAAGDTVMTSETIMRPVPPDPVPEPAQMTRPIVDDSTPVIEGSDDEEDDE